MTTATPDPKKVAAALIDAYLLLKARRLRLAKEPSITSPDAVQEPAGASPSPVNGCVVVENGKSPPDSGRRRAIREIHEEAGDVAHVSISL